MNVSYEWLRALVPGVPSPTQVRDLVTSRVATVDEVVALRQDLAPIVVARVVESVKIPDTRLSANKVDAGTGELLDVVCGAPNVTVGKLYPFAKTGTTVPIGLKIERRKIRGHVSNGMLCSPDELKLGSDHSGIMELDVDVAPGTPFLDVLASADTRIVVDVTPNRPDLLSHVGIAREVAAALGQAVTLPPIEGAAQVPAAVRVEREGTTADITVRVEDAALAPRYMGVVVRGVKIGPSPDWLVQRLEAVGARSINNVVDATNYVLHELGQPTHAFDLARLRGQTIVVRAARAGERITTLDGAERELQPSMTVIADADGPQAIAGVMGGRDSEVSEETTDIFLEVAVFSPSATRATRRTLGLSTDASYRFERGVDEELPPRALVRVAELVTALAGGRVDDPPIDVRASEPSRPAIALRAARVATLLGEPVPLEEMAALLRSIGFETTSSAPGVLDVVAPSWRRDIAQEVDLIEEVARLRGYDSFPDELRPQRPGNAPDSVDYVVARRVREALVAAGLLEVRPMPFVAAFDEGAYVRVANPLAENEAFLRREVLESLAKRAEHNLAHQQGNVRIFEIGSAFLPGSPHPTEEVRVAALVMGDRRPPHFTEPRPPRVDEWDVSWLAQVAARAAWSGARVELVPSNDPAALWQVMADGEVRGSVRRVSLDAPVWAAPAFGFELTVHRTSAAETAPAGRNAWETAAPVAPAPRRSAFRPLPTTPPAPFDLALLVPDQVTAADVERVIRRTAGDVLESLELFDLFEGEGVEPGFRSLAWTLIFRHPDRTLTAKEIEARRERILSALNKELNVRPRSA